ncbi:hypothetical protein TNCV_4707101 [Trichonephila clavipes]|nr:hypothetical protein TNCV_4707101 [Trichonephila clavipes]
MHCGSYVVDEIKQLDCGSTISGCRTKQWTEGVNRTLLVTPLPVMTGGLCAWAQPHQGLSAGGGPGHLEVKLTLNMRRLKYPPVGMMWKLGEVDASSGVTLVN